MVRSILKGEPNPAVLGKLRERNIKATEEQIQESLVGDYREETGRTTIYATAGR